METIFLFPVSDKMVFSSVSIDFTLHDGTFKHLESIIEERHLAEQKYDDAVASGKTAVMSGFTRT